MITPDPVRPAGEAELRQERRAARANARADAAEGRVRLLLSRAMGAEEARDNARRHSGWLKNQVDQITADRDRLAAENAELTVRLHEARQAMFWALAARNSIYGYPALAAQPKTEESRDGR